MGVNYSSNTATEAVSILNTVVNSSTTNCKVSTSEVQEFGFNYLNGTTVDVNINADQITFINTECFSTTSFNTSLTNSISQAATQLATAISQQFSLPAFSEADNVVQITAQLANTIQNTFVNNCSQTLSEVQQYTVNGANNSHIIGTLNFQQGLDDVNQCIFKNSAVNSLQNKLAQAVSQSATAKTANTIAGIIAAAFGSFFLIVAVVFVLLAFGVIGGGKSVTSGASSLTPPSVSPGLGKNAATESTLATTVEEAAIVA